MILFNTLMIGTVSYSCLKFETLIFPFTCLTNQKLKDTRFDGGKNLV